MPDLLSPRKRRKIAHDRPVASYSLTNTRAPINVSNYLHLILHVCGIIALLTLIVLVFRAVHVEINMQIARREHVLEEERLRCAHDYHKNQCHLYTHSSLFGEYCEQWRLCMDQDVSKVERTKIIVGTYGELVNAIVEPLSIKTMAVICILVLSAMLGSAWMF